nr:immunoglobulin light chain junction region [Mus musculus]NSL97338.1 immunoglobulin light chain junction region [Mus musculus]NSL97382.1 immunoglobulin light chain junction region [Mus musculus]NSL97427.1 immunoglobulin light chain junction region [Mus musculus]NSL97985.1 immunoglobulin light chain junction region [Mus musculus]
CQQWSSNPRTF